MRENRVQAFLNIECKACSNRVRFNNSTLEKNHGRLYAGRLYKSTLRLLLMKDSVIITQRKLERIWMCT